MRSLNAPIFVPSSSARSGCDQNKGMSKEVGSEWIQGAHGEPLPARSSATRRRASTSVSSQLSKRRTSPGGHAGDGPAASRWAAPSLVGKAARPLSRHHRKGTLKKTSPEASPLCGATRRHPSTPPAMGETKADGSLPPTSGDSNHEQSASMVSLELCVIDPVVEAI